MPQQLGTVIVLKILFSFRMLHDHSLDSVVSGIIAVGIIAGIIVLIRLNKTKISDLIIVDNWILLDTWDKSFHLHA